MVVPILIGYTIALFIGFLMGVFCFGIGAAILVRKKPLVVSSRWDFIFMILIFIPISTSPIISFVEVFIRDTIDNGNIRITLSAHIGDFPLMLLSLLMFLILTILFWIKTQGYIFYGINDMMVRDALHYGLQELGSPYEENFTKIKLSQLNTELQISVQPLMGTGRIKIKDRSKRAFLTKLVVQTRRYFREHDIPTNNVTAIYYLIGGSFMMSLMILGIILSEIFLQSSG